MAIDESRKMNGKDIVEQRSTAQNRFRANKTTSENPPSNSENNDTVVAQFHLLSVSVKV